MRSVVTKSAEALGRSGRPLETKIRVGTILSTLYTTRTAHDTKKAHKRWINVQTELLITSPPVSTQLLVRHRKVGVLSVPTSNQLMATDYWLPADQYNN